MQLRDAGRDEIERVLRATHSLRGAALAPDDDVALQLGLLETPWGRAHERYLLGRDPAGGPVGALKLVSLEGTLDDRRVRIARLGALFVFPEAGGAGRAEELMAAVLEEARVTGHTLALALTTGPGGPGALEGFRGLPCSEAACRVVLPAPWPKEPAWLAAGDDPLRSVPGLRPERPDDLDDVAAIHAEAVAGQRLRIDRDRGAWEQILLARDRLRGMGGGDAPFWVIETGGRVHAYVLLGAGRPTLRWLEHGARQGAEGLLADLFWGALAWARGRHVQRIEGWRMPEILTVAPLYPTSDRSRRNNVPMLRTLDPQAPPPDFRREDECRLWELDAI